MAKNVLHFAVTNPQSPCPELFNFFASIKPLAADQNCQKKIVFIDLSRASRLNLPAWEILMAEAARCPRRKIILWNANPAIMAMVKKIACHRPELRWRLQCAPDPETTAAIARDLRYLQLAASYCQAA